jgi:hypothetical protein
MELALVRTYLINFAYVILRAITYVIACVLACVLFDKLVRSVNFAQEIAERRNVGAAIVIAAVLLGLAYVIGQM